MRKLLLVLLVFGLFLGNMFAIKVKADLDTSLIYENQKIHNRIITSGDWIIKKDTKTYKQFISNLIWNYEDKEVFLKLKYVLIEKDSDKSYLLKKYNKLKIKKGYYKSFRFKIPQKIINQLKPKEYRLKVIMVEDGKEKVIGEREDITIEGDHIEKVYKSYSDIEFKDGVEYFEKDHKSGIKYEEEPMNPKHFPNIKIDKIKSNNEIIHNGKMNIIYNKKNNKKYELFFKVKLDKYYSWTGTDGRSGGKDPKQDFQGDIIIGLSQKSILSDFDIKLKTIKNLKLNPGESKKIKVTLNLDNLKKNCYKIIPIIYKKNGVKSIKGKVAHYSTEANDKLFIVKENLLKKYKVKQGYVLKDKDEEGSTK